VLELSLRHSPQNNENYRDDDDDDNDNNNNNSSSSAHLLATQVSFPFPSCSVLPSRLVAWLFARRFCSCVNIDADHIFYDIFFWLLSALAVVEFVCILAYPFDNFIFWLFGNSLPARGSVYVYAYFICTDVCVYVCVYIYILGECKSQYDKCTRGWKTNPNP